MKNNIKIKRRVKIESEDRKGMFINIEDKSSAE